MALKHTYAKLKDGSWGVRVSGPAPRVGDTVTVTKSNGETKQETIARVLFSGPDKYNHGQTTSLCAITQTPRQSSAPKLRRGCDCTDGCCDRGCRCGPECNCRGGPIYDC